MNGKTLGLLFLAISISAILQAQVTEFDTDVKLNSVKENITTSSILVQNEDGTIGIRPIESFNIPSLTIQDQNLGIELNGEKVVLDLSKFTSDPQNNQINSFQLNGTHLELGVIGQKEKFIVDLAPIILEQYKSAAVGEWQTVGTVTSNLPAATATNDLVFGSTTLDDAAGTDDDNRLFFDKSKGAFRAGTSTGTKWDQSVLGDGSSAFGINTEATMDNSAAFGFETKSFGLQSFTTGHKTTATNDNATAMGISTRALGIASISAGDKTRAESYVQTTIGSHSTNVVGDPDNFVATDRLFVVANGPDNLNKSDALTIFKNGNTTLNGTLTIDGDNVGGAGSGYTLPAQDGNANQYIRTDGAGNATWEDFPANNDNDPTNEHNTSVSLAGTVLTVTDGGGGKTADLASLQDGTGTDDQNISGSGLSGTTLTIGIENGTNEMVDLSSLQDGTGTDDQTLTEVLTQGASAGNNKITDLMDPAMDQDAATKKYVDDNDAVNDADSDPTNEHNTSVSLAGTVLTVTDGGGGKTADLASLQDGTGTDDQNISGSGLSGTTLTIGIENGTNEMVDLSSLQDGTGTDDQTLTEVLTQGASAGNNKITNLMDPAADQDAATKKYVDDNDAVNDADSDPTNEHNTMVSLSGTVLTVTDGGGGKTADLASLQDGTGTDDQNISGSGLSGTTLTIGIENGTNEMVDLSSLQDGTGTDDQNLTEVLTQGASAGNNKITNLMDPAADQDAATKKYVDDSAQTISAAGGASPTITLSGSGGTINLIAGTNVTLSQAGNNITINSSGGGGGGGSMTTYGDGSASDETISADTDWSASAPTNGNYMFNNFTIDAGRTLTVPSGTVIRCMGTFTNNGTIEVLPGIPESRWAGHPDDGYPRTPGFTQNNKFGYNSEALRNVYNIGPKGGANGSEGGHTGLDNYGGSGGGTLVIRAKVAFINAGTINAPGGNGYLTNAGSNTAGPGGGGGGFAIIISDGNVTNSGTINVKGGNGSSPGTADDDHSGGGGGGGLIHIISPNANAVAGTLNVSGGTAGVEPAGNFGSSGGEGGGSAGNGGEGGHDTNSNTVYIAAEDGFDGIVLRTQVAVPSNLVP